ncbi:MAG: S41 family peptidase [Victivallaceae bacterium]|nr:S41 family peptidase [Victivallaceae bacterium]
MMANNFRSRIIFPALLLGIVLPAHSEKISQFDLTAVQESPVSVDDTEAYDNLRRLVTVMKLLQQLYVDPEKVTMRKLVDGALKGMLHELDPYSSYEPFREEKNSHSVSRLAGVGIMGTKNKRSGLKVICTLKNSPAAKAGIRVGDLIVKIDDKPLGGLTYDQCSDLLRGKAGTAVKVELLRNGNDNPLFFQVTRTADTDNMPLVRDVRLLDNRIGYIRIESFGKQTAAFLDQALHRLKEKNCQGIILDLRNNPGGLVEAAVDLCSRFLATGEPVITIEGRDPAKAQKISAVKCKKYTRLPLLVLINRFSASAAEIVAGCLKDHKRAILLGSKTFGKGSVQRVCNIRDNGTLRFTVAKYYTPAHNVIHGAGIKPDIEAPLSLKACLLLAQQMENSPGVIHPAKKGMIPDVQLERAEHVLSGIIKLSEKKNLPAGKN